MNFNKFLFTLYTSPNYRDETGPTRARDYFLKITIVALLALIIELLIRMVATPTFGLVLVQTWHISVFIGVPIYIFSRSIKTSFLYSLILILVFAPLYILISYQMISFYWSAIFLLTIPVYYRLLSLHPEIKMELGLNKKRLLPNIFIGAGVGLAVCFYLYTLLTLDRGLPLSPLWTKELFLKFFIEISIGLMCLNLFFRYLLFYRLMRHYNWSYLLASFASTIFFAGLFLVDKNFRDTPTVIIGTIYLTVLVNYLSCYLITKRKSIVPIFFSDLIISLFITAFL